jgi:DNA-3-methyladenine glycosylase
MTPRAPRRLPVSFYERPTLAVLEDLIGKVLVHDLRGCRTAGVIVEAEAYIGEDDPACHAAPGLTRRNAPLYGPPGRAYVYLNYGLHYLVNAVTEREGSPAAVLVRALAPVEGLDRMRRRRRALRRRAGVVNRDLPDVSLCRGPGNLTVALGIDARQNMVNLVSGPLAIEDQGICPPRVDWSPRVGIRVGTTALWRATWAGHASVSGASLPVVR